MVEFVWPYLFLLLPIPVAVYFLFPTVTHNQTAALHVPNIEEFTKITSAQQKTSSSFIFFMIAIIAWALLIIAAAKPQWLGEAIELPVSGRDLILAVDLSESMSVEDFVIGNNAVNRLIATKKVAAEFIERRKSDRLGLILFGEQAYVQTPLTFDRKTVNTLLNESAIGLAGKRTAIGDAIGLAIKRFQNSDSSEDIDETDKSRVLILLTDGANTAGEVQPLQAAELAANLGLKIYTIGIGADEMIVRSFFGNRRVNPSTDLDEKALKAIASKTGGQYFRAHNTEELEQIYYTLDKLEPVEQDAETFRPTVALYYWPLTAALILSLFLVIIQIIRRQL